MRAKTDLLIELKAMLHDVFVAKSGGVQYQKLARAHGYVDGYMRALLETGVCTKQELLDVVAAERTLVDGPATAELIVGDSVAA